MRGLIVGILLLAAPFVARAEDEVRITKDIMSVTIETKEGKVEIKRNQNQAAVIDPDFAKTSRKCPPFCVTPMKVAPGVETMGELELIDFLKNKKGILVDARTTDFYLKGTIPGSVNIPYTDIVKPDNLAKLGCKGADCSGAKEIAIYCNGPWCEQSPNAIHALLKAGYPATKIHYYRDGMQGWKILGLNVVEGSL